MLLMTILLGGILYFTMTACSGAAKVMAYKKQKEQWLAEDRDYLKSRRQA